MDRWEILTEQPPPLHSAFEQLGSRGGQPPATQVLLPRTSVPLPTVVLIEFRNQPVARLKRLEPIVFDKIIVSMQTIQYGKVICIAFSDGTLHYRDRFTMAEIYHEIDVNRIMTLTQVGFRYPDSVPCRESPVQCLVSIRD